jgi:hypothetical protein
VLPERKNATFSAVLIISDTSLKKLFLKRYTTILPLNGAFGTEAAEIWDVWNEYFSFHLCVQKSFEKDEINAGSIYCASRLLCPRIVYPHYEYCSSDGNASVTFYSIACAKSPHTHTHRMLHACVATWSLTLREEHRLRVFENRVLRRIFGPKRDEVAGEWRK